MYSLSTSMRFLASARHLEFPTRCVAAFDVSVCFTTEFIPSVELSGSERGQRDMRLSAPRSSVVGSSTRTRNLLDETLFEHSSHDRARLTIPRSLPTRGICTQVRGDDCRVRPVTVVLEGIVKEEKEVVVCHGNLIYRFVYARSITFDAPFYSTRSQRKIKRTMSAIPASLQRLLRRLDPRTALSPSSEVAPAVSPPLPALAGIAATEAPTVALCARCRHALRRNPHKVRAGRARARVAQRDERGRFIGGDAWS
jgi:hypothetical protein